MNNTHKAVQYVVITHHDEIFNTEEPWDNMHAYESREISVTDSLICPKTAIKFCP